MSMSNPHLHCNKSLKRVITVTALGCAVIFYFLFDPSEYWFFPDCPLHFLTGLECPLCGLQRMIHHLLHGQIGPAFKDNPFLFMVSLYLLPLILFQFKRIKQRYKKKKGEKTIRIILLCGILFGIIRNFG